MWCEEKKRIKKKRLVGWNEWKQSDGRTALCLPFVRISWPAIKIPHGGNTKRDESMTLIYPSSCQLGPN